MSTYLALYQYHVLGSVWDPFFGNGSEKVLTSSLSKALPISDATLGAIAYLWEGCVELAGARRERWRTQPWLVLLVGATSLGLAVVSIALVTSQPLLTGTFCTLCLVSAAISLTVPWLVAEEVRAAGWHVRALHARGAGWYPSLRGWSPTPGLGRHALR